MHQLGFLISAGQMDRELLNTKVVREIIAMIASGQFGDGDRLPAERKLCEQFAVSRGTLREALADLEKMGAVSIKPGSGAYVQKFKAKKIPKKVLPRDFDNVTMGDVIFARKAIEVASIESACERVTQKHIAEAQKLIAGMENSLENLPEFIRKDMAFHELIVTASGNAALITAFEAIFEYHRYSQVFTSSLDECEETALEYHKKILSALKLGDKRAAVKVLSEHFDDMRS